jgi:hypothetical protein
VGIVALEMLVEYCIVHALQTLLLLHAVQHLSAVKLLWVATVDFPTMSPIFETHVSLLLIELEYAASINTK